MSKYLDRAAELRKITTTHYNCAQSVLLPFAEEAGLTDEQAMAIASNFGAGMRVAATCGAITGGLMALGIWGVDDPAAVSAFFRKVKEHHDGATNCADLLKINKQQGGEKKQHCDSMVFECVQIVEETLRAYGKIQ